MINIIVKVRVRIGDWIVLKIRDIYETSAESWVKSAYVETLQVNSGFCNRKNSTIHLVLDKNRLQDRIHRLKSTVQVFPSLEKLLSMVTNPKTN